MQQFTDGMIRDIHEKMIEMYNNDVRSHPHEHKQYSSRALSVSYILYIPTNNWKLYYQNIVQVFTHV